MERREVRIRNAEGKSKGHSAERVEFGSRNAEVGKKRGFGRRNAEFGKIKHRAKQ